MERKTLRVFIILSVLSILGIIVVQTYWFKKAFNLEVQEFSQKVDESLVQVAQRLSAYNESGSPELQPVKQQNPNYFIVSVNDAINPSVLEAFIKQEFIKQRLNIDFEYAIYDCQENAMKYGNYICQTENCNPEKASNFPFPKLKDDNYYFGVYFPHKNQQLLNQMGIWIFSSVVLLIVVMFFAYSLFFILRQRKLSEIQTDFINNMTHEFKTPIATVAISSKVLMDPEIVHTPKRLTKYAGLIKGEIDRLQGQVETVLQMARVGKDPQALQIKPINSHQILESIHSNFKDMHKGDGAKFDIFLNAKYHIIKADTLHLTNILHNLLDNALKYCTVRPEINIETSNQKNWLLIKITDNGIGISAKHQKLIFKQFYRVPTGNIHNVKGFGLGLNYVKTMVKAHKGKILLESEIGKGSCFILKFPISREERISVFST